MIFENAAYGLELVSDGRRLELSSVLSLSLLAAVDRVDGVDETTALSAPQVSNGTIVVERLSTLWERAWLELRCLETCVEVHTCVSGRGALGDVRLLGGRSLIAGAPLGSHLSGTRLPRLFSPGPENGLAPVRPVAEGAAIGVTGDGEPGRGRWLFTPAPLYFALGDETWLDLALAAPVADLRFVEVAVRGSANGFALELDYDGKTEVDGEFRAPVVIVTPDVESPFAGLRRHRDDLAARAFAPPPTTRSRPAWWSRPIFCGWGAQCHLAQTMGGPAADYATQERYDGFLSHLEEHGLAPGTVVLDDKWQATYGANEPDTEKWPDLKRWIAERHAHGQHVLLWWKAWDPEGLAPDLCVRNPDGEPVALDPANPRAREELRRIVESMLAAGGVDADGLKVDFTARTPSGRGLTHHGGPWGIALLHELLSIVYAAAKEAKPDALVLTHTPHPSFVDVTDMIRLNDVIAGDVVEQMTFRAHVARAACPELPIDTDDWPMPDKRSWRAFLDVKPDLGVPSLYFATHVADTAEELDADDYAAIEAAWGEWKKRAT